MQALAEALRHPCGELACAARKRLKVTAAHATLLASMARKRLRYSFSIATIFGKAEARDSSSGLAA